MNILNTYEIVSGRARAVISRTGGTILSFVVDGQNIFYPWRITENGKARGGCPICAPWFGSAPFAKEKHGYLRDLYACDVYHLDKTNIVLVFIDEGHPSYPWKMQYIVSALIYENGLTVDLQMHRLSDNLSDLAPVNPAFHPYFLGDVNQTSVVIDSETYSEFSDKGKMISTKNNSALIQLQNKEIRMKMNEEVSRFCLWSDAQDTYTCIEPVLYDKNLLGTPEGKALSFYDTFGNLSMELSVFKE